MPDKADNELVVLNDAPHAYGGDGGVDIDLSLLKDSLAKTPWERMLANDDAVNFGESLRAAMEKRIAKLKRTDAQTDRVAS